MAVNNLYLEEQFLCGVKSETTYGTVPTFNALDYSYVDKCDIKVNSPGTKRDAKINQINQMALATSTTVVDITIEGEYRVSGSAGKAYPFMDALELAAGFKSNVAGGVSVTYENTHSAAANFPTVGTSLSLRGIYSNQVIVVRGVYGNMKVTTNVSDNENLCKYTFTGKGLYSGSLAASTAPTISTDSDLVKITSASMLMHGYDPEGATFEVDYGVEIDTVPYMGDPYGVSKVYIKRKQPTFKLKCLMDAVGTFDPVTLFVNKTSGALSQLLHNGNVAGKRISSSFGTTQLADVTPVAENGVWYWDITGNINGDWTKKIY